MTHVIEDETRGKKIAELLRPEADDYVVLKPKQSGFFATSLDVLLKHLGAETLILAGFTGDICLLFTASDAHLRDYHLVIAWTSAQKKSWRRFDRSRREQLTVNR